MKLLIMQFSPAFYYFRPLSGVAGGGGIVTSAESKGDKINTLTRNYFLHSGRFKLLRQNKF
jgi:hypothetical protein